MNQAQSIFLDEDKNKQIVTIIESLLNDVAPMTIAKNLGVARSQVYKVKTKYIEVSE